MIFPYTKSGDAYDNGKHHAPKGGIYDCPSHPAEFQDGKLGLHMELFPGADKNGKINSGPFEGEVVNIAEIDNAGEKIAIIEKGASDGWQSYQFFTSWEWDWVDWVNYDRENQVARRDGMERALWKFKGDCDVVADASKPPSWDAMWGNCPMLPRFRHNATTNVMFLDGHAKAIPRGQIQWFKNIYVPVNASRQWTRQGWYPY
jgi:prepilin-type processing-associated H-X9-DG protein